MIHEFFHDCLISLEMIGQFASDHKSWAPWILAFLAWFRKELKEFFTVYIPMIWKFLGDNAGFGGIVLYIKTGSTVKKPSIAPMTGIGDPENPKLP